MSPRLEAIAARDGAACVWCGREVWARDRTLEHVVPRSRGGVTEDENLLLACRPCNRARRSKSVAAYARERRAAGASPRLDVLRAAVDRLAASPRRAHRAYGERQLAQLAGV